MWLRQVASQMQPLVLVAERLGLWWRHASIHHYGVAASFMTCCQVNLVEAHRVRRRIVRTAAEG